MITLAKRAIVIRWRHRALRMNLISRESFGSRGQSTERSPWRPPLQPSQKSV